MRGAAEVDLSSEPGRRESSVAPPGEQRVAGLTARQVAGLWLHYIAEVASEEPRAHAPVGPLLEGFERRVGRGPILSEATLVTWMAEAGVPVVPGPGGPYFRGLHAPGCDTFVDFFLHHTWPHPRGRLPADRLLDSYLEWAGARGVEASPPEVALAKASAFGYRTRTDGFRRILPGLIGREFDPAGWSPDWRWAARADPGPPSWWIARSTMHRRAPRSPKA